MIAKTFAVVITTVALGMPAIADDTMPATDGGRYTFNKVEGGFMRLDTQTGEVALCNPHAVGWACQAAPEDRAVLESEIARLRNENAALKKDILARGLPLPPGIVPEASAGNDREVILRWPDNADVDRAMAYVGRIWHRLVEALARAEKHVLDKS